VHFVEADIATMDLKQDFDIVLSVGVIHHTDDPDRTFANMYRHCREGGRVIIWTYSAEGNALVRWLVEPARKLLFARCPRQTLVRVSQWITAMLYPAIYSVYALPFMNFLPYYEYFQNARRMSFGRNVLNVFDKLNAPQVKFTTRAKCSEWFSRDRFVPESVSIRRYVGVSYSLTGVKRNSRSANVQA
jgi:SAM-dependent methyltransferase